MHRFESLPFEFLRTCLVLSALFSIANSQMGKSEYCYWDLKFQGASTKLPKQGNMLLTCRYRYNSGLQLRKFSYALVQKNLQANPKNTLEKCALLCAFVKKFNYYRIHTYLYYWDTGKVYIILPWRPSAMKSLQNSREV